MPRHLIDSAAISRDDIEELFRMADEGPQPQVLSGMTYLSAFFQESTRTRLGFAAAAAHQGATVLDMGSADRLRLEPADDQQMVLAGIADLTAVRHWDTTFARDLALRDQTCVVNAGIGGTSHPTQALIDAYTLTKTFGRNISGLRVLFVGALLRSAECFRVIANQLGVQVIQCGIEPDASRQVLPRYETEFQTADVIYLQSLSDTDYTTPSLNFGPRGPALPRWATEAVERSTGRIMHALPRGPELPDGLMWSKRSLVAEQVKNGLALRSAVLRWLIQA